MKGTVVAHRSAASREIWFGARELTVHVTVYTCVTGGYDDLDRMFRATPVVGETGFVAFTDAVEEVERRGYWQVRPLLWKHPTSPRRSARWCKVNSHLVVPDTEYSVWIDGAQQFANGVDPVDLVREATEKTDKHSVDLAVYRHPGRTCIYQEGEACKKGNKDDHETIDAQMAEYRSDGYPAQNGLVETGCVVRRHSPTIRRFNELWWEQIARGSLRDQLSFNYVVWKLGLAYGLHEGTSRNSRYLHLHPHRPRSRGGEASKSVSKKSPNAVTPVGGEQAPNLGGSRGETPDHHTRNVRVDAGGAMTREIWVAGYPSFVGGADTELDHLIDLWRGADVSVHLVPFGGQDPRMRKLCDERGCTTHDYRPGLLADKLVMGLCNGPFLAQLPKIAETGRPRRVLWANCMTFTTAAELRAHEMGLLDDHLFQSDYQRRMLLPKLEARGPVRVLEGYRPFFSFERAGNAFSRENRPDGSYFGVGRISRDDGAKYHERTWTMLAKVSAPVPVKAFMLGFGENAVRKCGPKPPCEWLDWMTWAAGAVPARELYRRIHVLMHLTGGSRENWPRTIVEAWAAGVVPIVDDDYGVTEMVTDGVDGFRVNSPDEAAYRASQLAFDPTLRQSMVEAGLRTLLDEHCDRERSMEPFLRVFQSSNDSTLLAPV